MPRFVEVMRETFWVLALAVIALFTFLVALGAFSPADAIWATIVVGLLCVMWVMHAVLEGRHRDGRDPAVRARAGASRLRAPLGTSCSEHRQDAARRVSRSLRGVLDPEIQPIVDLMEAAPAPPGGLLPISQARAVHDLETAELSGAGQEVAEVRELELPGPGGPIPLRFYRPDVEGTPPLVAYAHGGGWAVGSLDSFDPLCRALANASGAAIASIGYRLAPEHPFPAATEDVRAAVRWLAEHARELGADPARLGIAGDSAGGNLAAVTARRLRDDGDSPLRFQALIYPVCDSALNTPSYRENGSGFGLTAAAMKALLGAVPRRRRRPPPRCVAAEGGRPRRAPARVRADRARRRAARRGRGYARALEAAGVPVTLRRYDGAVHGFFRWLAKAELARRAVAETGAALRRGPRLDGPSRPRWPWRPCRPWCSAASAARRCRRSGS